MSTNQTPPALAEVMGTLDELAADAKAGDGTRYRAALHVAERQALTEEQISDAYRWGRRRQGAAAFDWQGNDPRGCALCEQDRDDCQCCPNCERTLGRDCTCDE